ncbi:MAG: hypothetical protein LBV38_01515, partial [Alistipes sp.]|nr:hypothetical protein [Alistipes sp.]
TLSAAQQILGGGVPRSFSGRYPAFFVLIFGFPKFQTTFAERMLNYQWLNKLRFVTEKWRLMMKL